MRGLKPKKVERIVLPLPSHLLQMRGLKLVTMYAKVNNIESHLLQMRGLKRNTRNNPFVLNVASFTDAWIETRR